MNRLFRKSRSGGGSSRIVAALAAIAVVLSGLVCAPGIAQAALSDHTVQGVSPRGTTINLFDYWIQDRDTNDQSNGTDYQNRGINANHVLKFGAGMGTNENEDVVNSTAVNSWTGDSAPRQGIVSDLLSADGYPVLSGTGGIGTESLSYLFSDSEQQGKASYIDVDGLLQVDDDGYYYYNSQANFAEFDEQTESFTLYDRWGVRAGGSSPNGQFFPFNSGAEVFTEVGDELQEREIRNGQSWNNGVQGTWNGGSFTPNAIISTDADINHYFGLNMSTRFIQRYGGHTAAAGTAGRQEVTYNFSGDDDVWIYIDGVLVGDLGGIHDKSSIEINFADGSVVIYHDVNNDNVYNENDDGTPYEETTLRALFQAALGSDFDASDFDGDTFADNTYHTLDFFYLERGNTDSNMSLKYNLVNVPESGVLKVDQYGDEISGVTFTLREADQNYNIVGNGYSVTGTTDATGEMIFTTTNSAGKEMPITLEQLRDLSPYWVLTEGNVPEGYRNSGDIHLRFEDGVLLASNEWDTGAYSQAHVTASAPSTVVDEGGASHDISAENGGTLFAVVMQKGEDGDWYPVSGDAFSGWHVADGNTNADIIAAAQEENSQYQFLPGSAGDYEVTIENLPGDITKYAYMLEINNGDVSTAEYTVRYYWSDADSIADMTASSRIEQIETDANTATGYDGIGRVFSVTLNIPNIKNELSLIKTDADTGEPLAGAEFTMYTDANRNGAVDADERVCFTGTTGTDGRLDITSADGADGSRVLAEGFYVLVETQTPSDYIEQQTPIQIVVDDDGVHVNAGSTGDNVSVETSIGNLVWSMKGFAAGDDVDATLHEVSAQPQTSTGQSYPADESSWTNDGDALHYHYNDATDTLDYIVTGDGDAAYVADAGWSRLDITQCTEHDADETDSPKENLGNQSLNALFDGDVTIQVTNSKVPTTGSLTVSKTVEGTGAPEDAIFDFDLSVADAGGSAVTGTFDATTRHADGTTSTEQIALVAGANEFSLAHDESVTISGLPDGAAYTVTEAAKAYYSAKVSPDTGDSEQGDGLSSSGTIKAGAISAVAYTNTFTGGSVDYDARVELVVYKTLKGRSMFPDEFSVVMDPADQDSSELIGLASADDVITFGFPAADDGVQVGVDLLAGIGDIEFTAANDGDVYTYTVYEQVPEQSLSNGVTYDDVVYTLIIEVAVDNDGVVTATTSVFVDGASEPIRTVETTSNSGASFPVGAFENTYNATGELGGNGAVSIEATKTLANAELSADDFTFTVSALNTDNSVKPRVDATATNGTNGASSAGEIVFPAIEYTSRSLAQDVADGYAVSGADADGNPTYTYTYAVAEDTTGFSDEGLSIAQASFTVEVVVTDDGDGTLEVAVSYPEGSEDGLTFANVYGADATATLEVGGTKIYEKNGFENAPSIEGAYTFTISGVDENDDAAPLPADTTAQNANGSFSFGMIEYDITDLKGEQSMTFTYKVTEAGSVDGVANDPSAADGKTFEVTVSDNGDGTISVDAAAQATAGKQVSFTNAYSADPTDPSDPADPTSGVVSVSKDLTGRDLRDGEFSFQIAAAGEYGSAASPASLTGTNDAEGNVTFDGDGFVFSEPGEYRFTISEVDNGVAGVTYDTSEYTATATVTDDGNGQLEVTWEVTDADGAAVDAIAFKNSYAPSAVSVPVVAGKQLTGRDLASGEFEFQLTRDYDDGSVAGTATNTADGSVSFVLRFDAAGVYTYTMSEVAGDAEGVTYDDAAYQVAVTVTDDGSGQLSAAVEYGTEDGSAPVFVNSYDDGGDEPTTPGDDSTDTGTDTDDGTGSGGGLAQTGDNTVALVGGVALAAVALVAGGVVLRRRASR